MKPHQTFAQYCTSAHSWKDLEELYLHDSLKHWNKDKLDESNLSCGFGNFIPVHEGSDGETLRFLPVALENKFVKVLLLSSVYSVFALIWHY